MPIADRISVLLDGGFVTKRLETTNKHFPTALEITTMCTALLALPALSKYELYRIYFYDCEPYSGTEVEPISKTPFVFSGTNAFNSHQSLLDSLEQSQNFAVRKGELIFKGWKLGDKAFHALLAGQKSITNKSLVPNLAQKGVDMRIGLDIAALALKRLVSAVVLVSGDSDMIPAMKFARREGLRVYLHTMGRSVRTPLKAHADVVI